MDSIMILAIVLAVIALFGFGIFLFFYIKKKRLLRKLAEKYGKPSTRVYDERDFTNIGKLFKLFPAKGKETIDDITWFDIQMPLVYQQMNHSVSHIGDEYLHRHIRTQQYEKLDRLEKHIKYFDEHPEERLKLQYAFYHINPATRVEQTRTHLTDGKKSEVHFVEHLNNPGLFPKISIIPYASILLITIFSGIALILFGIDTVVGIVSLCLLVANFVWSALYLEKLLAKVKDYIPSFKSFYAGFKASAQIAKLDQNMFDKELEPLLPVLKRLHTKSKQISSLIDISMFQSELASAIGIFTFIFGLHGFVYQWAVKMFKKNTDDAMIAYESIGYIELCISLSSYRKTLPYFCHPEFSEDTHTEFDELYHPLLKNPVTNSRTINNKLIITGANASGKSTFIKTLAINAIIAQNINMCYAERFRMKPAYVYSAMNLSDDITTGDSFYMAEIKRLKSFLNSLSIDSYKMFFVDEILKGTNTTERIAAASTILKRFAKSGNFFCLATHDTELTGILQHFYSNYHFEENTTDTEIHYDYKLYDGVTPGSNAIALLRVMQYDQAIVDDALKLAQDYRNNKVWPLFTI